MSKDLPVFLPSECPTNPILDLSNSLSSQAISNLNAVAASVTFKPIVVVLPKDYTCADPRLLTIKLAQRWGIDGSGKNLLIVVDLKGHKVRAHGSPELSGSGVTSDYISNTLIPQQFIPYMKQGDLANAIRLTVLDVNRVQSDAARISAAVPARTDAATTRTLTQTASVPPTDSASPSPATILGMIIFGAVCIMSVMFFMAFSKLKANKQRFDGLTPQLDYLFKKADQLSEASDFLKTADNANLAHKIADFFAQLETVQKAQVQVQQLIKNPLSASAAERALTQLESYAQVMNTDGIELLRQVNAATGNVETYQANPVIGEKPDIARQTNEKPAAITTAQEAPLKSVQTAYREPSWLSQPSYQRTVGDDGLRDLALYLGARNEAQTMSVKHSSAANEGSDGGNSWSSGSQGIKSNARHGDEKASNASSDKSSDGGGSWDNSSSDSSSSSSSSSDGGGSW